MTDLGKMADGPEEGQDLLGRKVMKLLELEGLSRRTMRTGIKNIQDLDFPKSESNGVHFYAPPRESSGRGLGHVGKIT